MTDIDVPDWVVRAAMLGEQKFYAEKRYTSFSDVGATDAADAMRAALRAALSAWVVQQHQCMCTDEDEVPNGPRDIWMDVSADDYPKLTARNDVRGRTLYALRQEKPE